MQRIDLAARRALDSNSAGESGALLTLYKNGTNTPVTTFADADGSSANSTPVVADGSGNFPAIYAPAGTYRLGITDSTGADLAGFPYDDFSVGGNAPSFLTLADALSAQAYLETGDVFRVYGHTTKGDTSPFEVEVQASADVDFPSEGKLKPLLQAGRYNFNWWGGFPDAVTNLTDTFQQFANFQRRHSYKVGDLYVPGGDKFYQVNRPFRRFSYQRWVGDGTGGHSPQTRIFNGAGNNTDFWANSVCYDGTFFGEGTGESVFDLLNPMTCNATTVPTTVLTGVSSHSLPDDAVICVASVGLRSGTSYRSYATLRRVVASTSTTITLDEPVYQPLVGGGQIWEVPTDPDHDAATVSIRAADAGVDRFYEGDAYLAVSLITEGIRFGQRGSAQDSAGQIVHASSMDALYRNCRFEGSLSAFAGNPFSRFLVEKCTIMGQHRALEMAYLSGEGVYRDCHFEIREPLIPSEQQTGGGYVIRHSSESSPGRARFDNCTATWGASGNGQGTSSGIPAAVDLQGEGATWVGGFIDGGAKEQSIACAGEAAHIEGATVSGGTVSAIATTRDRASLTNCRVIPNDTPRTAAAVKVGARDGTVIGCDLGGGPDGFVQLANFTELREANLQVASNTNFCGLNAEGRILSSYTVKHNVVSPADTYSGKTNVFASEVAVAPARPGFPTLEEIETWNGANTDRIINYNGSETDDGEYTRVYYVSAGGVMSRVDTTDVPVSNATEMTLAVVRWNGIQFADDTTVAPAESGEPTTAEIIAFASGKVNTVYNYTGTDDDTDPITHSFYIGYDGTCTRVYTTTGNVTVDTQFRLELAMKIGAAQVSDSKYIYVDYSDGAGGWTNYASFEFANNVLFEGRMIVEARRFHADDRLVGIRANVAGNTEVMKRATQANHAGTNAIRVRLKTPAASSNGAISHYETDWKIKTPESRLSTQERPMEYRPISERDRRLLVATVHYEAASESDEGKAAVAQVILNRAFNPRRNWTGGGGGPVENTVFAKWQFSCWNDRRGERLRALFVGGDPDRGWISDKAAAGSREAVRGFLTGDIRPGVEGCSHYLNPATAPQVGNALNTWGSGWRNGKRIGRHVFLRPEQLTPAEAGIEPVEIVLAPAVPVPDRGAWATKLMRYGRRFWAFLSAAATLIVTQAQDAWDALTNHLWGAGVDPSDALAWAQDNPKIIIGGLLIAAFALYLWKRDSLNGEDTNRAGRGDGETVVSNGPVVNVDDGLSTGTDPGRNGHGDALDGPRLDAHASGWRI